MLDAATSVYMYLQFVAVSLLTSDRAPAHCTKGATLRDTLLQCCARTALRASASIVPCADAMSGASVAIEPNRPQAGLRLRRILPAFSRRARAFLDSSTG